MSAVLGRIRNSNEFRRLESERERRREKWKNLKKPLYTSKDRRIKVIDLLDH